MKNNFLLLLIILAATFGQSLCAQTNDYFPLRIGNTWTYDNTVDNELITQVTINIIDTVKFENKKYFLFDRFLFARTLKDSVMFRIEGEKVFCFIEEDEQLFLDFAANVNDFWFIKVFDTELDSTVQVKITLLRKGIRQKASGRTFDDCYIFEFDVLAATDIGWGYAFASQVGCVIYNIATSVPQDYKFRDGTINGIYYPDLISSVKNINDGIFSKETTLSAFPNPFNSSVFIVLKDNPSNFKKQHFVRIYNIKGQVIKSLPMKSDVSDGCQTLEWRGDDDRGRTVSSDIYFITYFNGKHNIIKKISLLK